MEYNYWKCKVSRRPNAVKRRWVVTVIETDAVVIRCGTWERAVRKAIKFQHVQNRSNGKGWTVAEFSGISKIKVHRLLSLGG